MKEITVQGETFTAQQLADQFSCSVKTIHNHANFLFGSLEKGFKKARLFNEGQTTAILEHIKKTTEKGRPVGDDKAIEKVLQTQETAQSLDFQLAIIERRAHELWKRKALEQESRAVAAEQKLQATENLLASREEGLSIIQRIAESEGRLISDRDDLIATYRRRNI
jgi:hypothetical protein